MTPAFSRAVRRHASPPINVSQLPLNIGNPYRYERAITAKARVILMLIGGILFAQIAFAVSFIAADVLRRFDVIPYVADGSVFGCQPVVLKTVEPEGLL